MLTSNPHRQSRFENSASGAADQTARTPPGASARRPQPVLPVERVVVRAGQAVRTVVEIEQNGVERTAASRSSDDTWQAFTSVGNRFNDRWSTQLGYRYMSIEKEIGGADTSIELYGPLLGATAHF